MYFFWLADIAITRCTSGRRRHSSYVTRWRHQQVLAVRRWVVCWCLSSLLCSWLQLPSRWQSSPSPCTDQQVLLLLLLFLPSVLHENQQCCDSKRLLWMCWAKGRTTGCATSQHVKSVKMFADLTHRISIWYEILQNAEQLVWICCCRLPICYGFVVHNVVKLITTDRSKWSFDRCAAAIIEFRFAIRAHWRRAGKKTHPLHATPHHLVESLFDATTALRFRPIGLCIWLSSSSFVLY